MTTGTDRIQAIFQDARELQADALEMLAQGRIRNAAEKVWGATKRATDALVLARTGEEPEFSPETAHGLRMLESLDEAVREARMVRHYYTRQGTPTVIASTWVCAIPSRTRSVGSGRRRTTSTTPCVSPTEMPDEKADDRGNYRAGDAPGADRGGDAGGTGSREPGVYRGTGLEVQGTQVSFGGTLQEPGITTRLEHLTRPVVFGDSADATFGGTLHDP